MNKIRAIYVGDVRFNNCPVFELNVDSNQFVMLSDDMFRYDKELVMEDEDFYVFNITEDGDIGNVERIK